MMGDTAVETECLGDIDREKIVATIENERTKLVNTEVTPQDAEQQDLELRLDDSREGIRSNRLSDEANGDVTDSVQIGKEQVLTTEVELGSNSVERSDFAFAASTSPEISATDAKESSDSNEGADLVTIMVLEKTEEEKSNEILNGRDQIIIGTSVVSHDNAVNSGIKHGNHDEVCGNNDKSSIDCNVNSSADRNGVSTESPESDSPKDVKPADDETPPTATSAHAGTEASAVNSDPIESSERFLILNNNSPPEGSSSNGEPVAVGENAASTQTSEQAVKEEAGGVPAHMDEDRFKEIEILVAAFDGLEENSSNQSTNEPTAAVAPTTSTQSEPPCPAPQGAEVPAAAPGRRSTPKISMEPKSEKKLPKAKRTGGPPTRRESAAAASDKTEIPNVVGNGKLRVHGYEKLNEQTGLPELVLVNREILERIISDQEKTILQTKAKLKEMCKNCDDLRKVVLAKGLNTVLSQEEANLPVDVVIKMQKLPPHVPTFQTADPGSAEKKRRKEHVVVRNSKAAAQVVAAEITTTNPQSDDASGLARDVVNVLPKDIVRALTNGDVLTVQQRQRFIDKITYDIIKAKGVPQPQQIQEIAMQVANMYPRSLVILPEGKRKSSLRKRGRGDDDDEDCEVKSSVPKRAKKESLSKAAAESPAGASQVALVSETGASDAAAIATPVAKRGRGRPPKNRSPAVATPDPKSATKTAQAATPSAVPSLDSDTVSTAVVNGSPAAGLKRKAGRAKKAVQPEPNPRHVEEEQALSLEEQKKWLQEDVKKPIEQQDAAKQLRLLHNCYDMLYQEMAANNYDCAATIAEWPVLRKAEHVLSVFKRLKRVHGRFQEGMRKDAPKLVTFLHERVNTEEGAEWSLRISQAKLSDRYQLPEEVGVMPLLALNFEEDFSLLFKLVPDSKAFDDAIKHVEPVPIIIGVGESIFNCDYHVVVERQLLYSPKTYLDALELVYAAYFVFNLAYPKELLNTFEYVQRYYVGYNPPIKMVTLSHTRPKIALFLKKLKDFERLDWNSNIRANSPGVPSEFERESDPDGEDMDATEDPSQAKPEGDVQSQQQGPQTSVAAADLKPQPEEKMTETGAEEQQPMETDDHAAEKNLPSAPEAPEAVVTAAATPVTTV